MDVMDSTFYTPMCAYYLTFSNCSGYFAFIRFYRITHTKIKRDDLTIYFTMCIIIMSVWKKLKHKISTSTFFLSGIFDFSVL